MPCNGRDCRNNPNDFDQSTPLIMVALAAAMLLLLALAARFST